MSVSRKIRTHSVATAWREGGEEPTGVCDKLGPFFVCGRVRREIGRDIIAHWARVPERMRLLPNRHLLVHVEINHKVLGVEDRLVDLAGAVEVDAASGKREKQPVDRCIKPLRLEIYRNGLPNADVLGEDVVVLHAVDFFQRGRVQRAARRGGHGCGVVGEPGLR